ncbi:permease-like cell division protein FtsX [Candidatus Nephthysia bennettiae]|uniref:cell division protein FtsX n=1 Tax=Candidatus Nephthysia bennettiae TaxID=3127016 RepID=UPI0030C70DE7
MPVTSAGVLSITLILVLAGTCLILGHAFGQVLDGYKQRVSVISISVADQTPMLTVEDFEDQLRQRPEVVSVRFVSKDEELRRFSEDPRNQQLIEQIQGNPVPAKIEVRVSRLADVKTIDTVARQWRGADRTDPTDYQGDFITNMLRLSSWLTIAGLGMLAVLTVASIVIVMNTIRTAVYHRRQEIEVMKLVGATEWFVRGPFVLEGVLTGLIAAALALGLLMLAYRPFVERFQSELFFVPLTYDPRFVGVLGPDLLLAGVLLGAMGSYIGVRRFVRI